MIYKKELRYDYYINDNNDYNNCILKIDGDVR